MSNEVRIYVADLAAYNNGKLHGVWIDACDDLDSIQDQINEMLAKSPEEIAEEYAIHDHEGFEGYPIGEYEGTKEINAIACFIEEHGEVAGELLSTYNGNVEEAELAMIYNYSGQYSSLEDFAQKITEEASEIPENLAYYIDYERMGRDMEMGGDIFTIQTAHDEVHIFWNH
jgi:antirestriction protein